MADNTLSIVFIGAGQVNFGGGEGPWNHVKRLEQIHGTNISNTEGKIFLRVLGISDPFQQHAQKVLENQRKISKNPEMWTDTQVFGDFVTMFNSLPKVDAVFIGVPPGAHGSVSSSNNIEVECAKRGIHMFVEKPLSCYPVEEVKQVADAVKDAAKNGLVVSVGYMFRYSRAIQKIKEVIRENGPARAFNARYSCAYSTISKEMWWNIDQSGGPIVEQGTHFCDLARFLVGEINLDTVQSIAIKQTDQLGELKALAPNVVKLEERLEAHKRIPRVTSSFWRFENGAVGTLMHTVLLHGLKYENEIEIWGDGYRICLLDPYDQCKVQVRLASSDESKFYEFLDDDYYHTEDRVFLEAIVKKNTEGVLSLYEDAMKTYEFTWKIRLEAEK